MDLTSKTRQGFIRKPSTCVCVLGIIVGLCLIPGCGREHTSESVRKVQKSRPDDDVCRIDLDTARAMVKERIADTTNTGVLFRETCSVQGKSIVFEVTSDSIAGDCLHDFLSPGKSAGTARLDDVVAASQRELQRLGFATGEWSIASIELSRILPLPTMVDLGNESVVMTTNVSVESMMAISRTRDAFANAYVYFAEWATYAGGRLEKLRIPVHLSGEAIRGEVVASQSASASIRVQPSN